MGQNQVSFIERHMVFFPWGQQIVLHSEVFLIQRLKLLNANGEPSVPYREISEGLFQMFHCTSRCERSLSPSQGVSVEAVDPVFQAKMLDMLKQTGRPEMVVGWYHSHPGFGCWLSGVDINTQQSFETLSTRAVAVVVDPIQSVKGEGGRERGVPLKS